MKGYINTSIVLHLEYCKTRNYVIIVKLCEKSMNRGLVMTRF